MLWVARRVPEECPPEIAQLIKSCCSGNPEERPTAREAFQLIQACTFRRADSADAGSCEAADASPRQVRYARWAVLPHVTDTGQTGLVGSLLYLRAA
jgi:hypothetical protein